MRIDYSFVDYRLFIYWFIIDYSFIDYSFIDGSYELMWQGDIGKKYSYMRGTLKIASLGHCRVRPRSLPSHRVHPRSLPHNVPSAATQDNALGLPADTHEVGQGHRCHYKGHEDSGRNPLHIEHPCVLKER